MTWFAAPTLFNIPNPPSSSHPARRRPIIKHPIHDKKTAAALIKTIRHIEAAKAAKKMELESKKKEMQFLQRSGTVKRLKRALKAKKEALIKLRKKATIEAQRNQKEELLEAVKDNLSSEEYILLSVMLRKHLRRGQAYNSDVKLVSRAHHTTGTSIFLDISLFQSFAQYPIGSHISKSRRALILLSEICSRKRLKPCQRTVETVHC